MARRPKRHAQLPLGFRTWGGKRKGAGRKPKGDVAGVSHSRRPAIAASHPVHVTLRVARSVPNLRAQVLMRVLRAAFSAARSRLGARLVHFSVQRNHIHLLVEAAGRPAVSRAIQGLCVRIARRLNGALGRRGSVFSDRFHARALKSPRETRNALAYVLLNRQHHAFEQGGSASSVVGLDACSSSPGFDGWRRRVDGARAGPCDEVVPARTWLLSTGWRRHGLIDPYEVPGLRRR